MTKAERVLAEMATKIHGHSISYNAIRELTAPYLPKPEPDRLTVAAREVSALCNPSFAKAHRQGVFDKDDIFKATRAIIAREVAVATADITSQRDAAAAAACYHIEKAVAEPSDEALWRVVWAANNGGSTGAIRAALGE